MYLNVKICAFTGDIQLYILDEPLITIDADSAQVLYKLINQYQAKGSSFLLSSHQELEPGQLTIGMVYAHYLSVCAVLLCILTLLVTVSGYMFRIINYSHVPAEVYLKTSLPRWNKPYWTWPFYYLLKEQTLMLVAGKVLSFALFNAVMWVFADVSGDIRVALIGILAAVLAHSMLIHALLKNEVDRLSFTRNLPITLSSKMAQRILVLLLLFIPEIIFYLHRTGINRGTLALDCCLVYPV